MICGVDEAGRGPVLGPLVIAGVVFESEDHVRALHVRDSKQLSPSRRSVLEKKIKEHALTYEIVVIPAKDIDEMRKSMTLNELEVYAFAKIIEQLKPSICYVDAADVNEKRFGSGILSQLTHRPKLISKHKADDLYPIVGAASILAKTKRDEIVASIEQQLQKKLDMPLGSGYPADPLTKAFLSNWVKRYKNLPPHVRHSWKTAQRLMNSQHMKSLDDF